MSLLWWIDDVYLSKCILRPSHMSCCMFRPQRSFRQHTIEQQQLEPVLHPTDFGISAINVDLDCPQCQHSRFLRVHKWCAPKIAGFPLNIVRLGRLDKLPWVKSIISELSTGQKVVTLEAITQQVTAGPKLNTQTSAKLDSIGCCWEIIDIDSNLWGQHHKFRLQGKHR